MNRLTLTLQIASLGIATSAFSQHHHVSRSRHHHRTSHHHHLDNSFMPNSSRFSRTVHLSYDLVENDARHHLVDNSMFGVEDAKPRIFQKHDLVQIVVQESSRAESTHELSTEKDYDLDGRIDAWPHLDLNDLLNLQLKAGNTPASELPRVGVGLSKEFEGEGEYTREDDFTTRITAEVIAVRPNGNLVLEVRTTIKMDEEEQRIKVTGECRSEDVSITNTLVSNRIHDLKVEKTHTGELKKANEKGLIAKFIDALFAF